MRWLRAGFLPVSMLILLAGALFVPLPIFLERPGRPVSLAACVQVDDENATPVTGDFLLMTISVGGGTAVDALVAAFDRDTLVVRREGLIPAGEAPAAYFRRQRQAFVTTADVAAAVGLQAAGMHTEMTGEGVSVIQTFEDTPAAALLLPGDIIKAVNGEPVLTEDVISEAIASVPVGEPLILSVRRGNRDIDVRIAAVDSDGTPIIGIEPETVNPRVTLPVAVDVASGPTGGPSAGLTIALTVYDQVLPGVDLAAGRTVAGTGTIDYSGQVGPIGGAGLKVVAADRIGADVFLVPELNYAEALAALPPGSPMEIVKIATFADAQRVLEETAPENAAGDVAQSGPCPYGTGT